MARKAKTFGEMLLQSANEAVAIARGDAKPARAYVPEKVDVSAIRAKANMTQERFAETYGIPKGTLRDWEQDRRQPDQTARVFLTMIEREPVAVAGIIRGAMLEARTARVIQKTDDRRHADPAMTAEARRQRMKKEAAANR